MLPAPDASRTTRPITERAFLVSTVEPRRSWRYDGSATTSRRRSGVRPEGGARLTVRHAAAQAPTTDPRGQDEPRGWPKSPSFTGRVAGPGNGDGGTPRMARLRPARERPPDSDLAHPDQVGGCCRSAGRVIHGPGRRARGSGVGVRFEPVRAASRSADTLRVLAVSKSSDSVTRTGQRSCHWDIDKEQIEP